MSQLSAFGLASFVQVRRVRVSIERGHNSYKDPGLNFEFSRPMDELELIFWDTTKYQFGKDQLAIHAFVKSKIQL